MLVERAAQKGSAIAGSPDRDMSGTLIETAATHEGSRVLALPMQRPHGVILDVDGTLHTNGDYRRAVADGELAAVGAAVGVPPGLEAEAIRTHREWLGTQLGRPARLTETVRDFGLTQQWWDQTRNGVYRPEKFLTENPTVPQTLEGILDAGGRVAVASNTPSSVVDRVLTALGVDEGLKQRIHIAGPDTIGVSKPDPRYFERVSAMLGVPPEQCVSIGDDEQNDGHPAIDAGMGAVSVTRPDDIRDVTRMLFQEGQYKPFDMEGFARGQFRPGEVAIVGLTGRAGAGKTTTAQELHAMYDQLGIPSAVLGLDAFFRLSSRERKAWLKEGKLLGEEEYARRADQAAWWDFGQAAATLDTLRAGNPVHLSGVYNRGDKGELTGELHIEPDPRGMVVILEGVATAHLKKPGDHFMYVNAHPRIRRGRLLGRDADRRGTNDAATERFGLTQGFENDYFPRHITAIDTVVENSKRVLTSAPAVPLL